MIERRWPWKTSLTRLCIWPPASSRKRVAAFVIDTSSSPTLKIATPFTPTGIFCLSTPVTSSSAASISPPSASRARNASTPAADRDQDLTTPARPDRSLEGDVAGQADGGLALFADIDRKVASSGSAVARTFRQRAVR